MCHYGECITSWNFRRIKWWFEMSKVLIVLSVSESTELQKQWTWRNFHDRCCLPDGNRFVSGNLILLLIQTCFFYNNRNGLSKSVKKFAAVTDPTVTSRITLLRRVEQNRDQPLMCPKVQPRPTARKLRIETMNYMNRNWLNCF